MLLHNMIIGVGFDGLRQFFYFQYLYFESDIRVFSCNTRIRNCSTPMKLRIRGNSLRFRLTQGEVTRLLAEGKISESVQFSPSFEDKLTYSLETCTNASKVSASLCGAEVNITIPANEAAQWANTSRVGIEQTQFIGMETDLRITIEKDFRCLQPRLEEDESDNYPNPESTACNLS